MRDVTRSTTFSPFIAGVLVLLLSPGLAFANQQPPDPAPPTAAPPAPPLPAPLPAPPPPTSDPALVAPASPPPAPAPAAPGGLKIEGTNASFKLGFLLQSAYQFDNNPTADTTAHWLFLRRARLMLGVTIGKDFELFAESDSPNLGRATPTGGGASANPGMNLQDAFGTWKPMDEFKVDVGLMLTPLSHNSLQGATTLYGWDYYAFSFLHNAGLTNYVGRDIGLQLRGVIMKKLEYRAAVYQGNRAAPPMTTPPTAPTGQDVMRFAGRLQLNLLDAETAYFYAGTYGGAKRILSVGGGIDAQDDYLAIAGDVFVDMPLGTDVLTVQGNVIRYDGGTWIPLLAKQTVIMAEAGYRIGAIQVSPIVRFEHQMMSDDAAANMTRIAGGLAWWVMNHNVNLKAFYTNIKPEGGDANHQVNVQLQLYVF